MLSSSVGGVNHYGPALYVVDADGRGRYRLTRTETPGVHFAIGERPVWSPDSRRIAFRRVMIPEALGILDVYVVDVDGTNEQRVTETPNILEYIGDWTPAGPLPATPGRSAPTPRST